MLASEATRGERVYVTTVKNSSGSQVTIFTFILHQKGKKPPHSISGKYVAELREYLNQGPAAGL